MEKETFDKAEILIRKIGYIEEDIKDIEKYIREINEYGRIFSINIEGVGSVNVDKDILLEMLNKKLKLHKVDLSIEQQKFNAL